MAHSVGLAQTDCKGQGSYGGGSERLRSFLCKACARIVVIGNDEQPASDELHTLRGSRPGDHSGSDLLRCLLHARSQRSRSSQAGALWQLIPHKRDLTKKIFLVSFFSLDIDFPESQYMRIFVRLMFDINISNCSGAGGILACRTTLEKGEHTHESSFIPLVAAFDLSAESS